MWRTRTAIIGSLKVINGLIETLLFHLSGGTHFERRLIGRDVVGRPMVPGAVGSIGIVAEKDKAASAGRSVTPLQGRGDVFAVARIAARNHRSVSNRARRQAHEPPPCFDFKISSLDSDLVDTTQSANRRAIDIAVGARKVI